MYNVTVNKNELIKRLEENRSSHKALFEKGREGYEKLVARKAEEALSALRSGEINPFAFRLRLFEIYQLAVPEDHTKDYDAILDMLTMTTVSELEISQADFRSYVRDEWDWAPKTTMTNSLYAGMAN